MITFSDSNIFKFNRFLNPNETLTLTDARNLTNFTFVMYSNTHNYFINKLELLDINGNAIDLLTDKDLILNYFSNEEQRFYFIYNYDVSGNFANLTCGVFQLKVTLKKVKRFDGTITYTNQYSNFFQITDLNNLNFFKLYNSKDFNNVLFSKGFYYKFLTEKKLTLIEPQKIETIIETGGITQLYESQVIANQYNLKFLCDVYTAQFFESISLFDTYELQFEYENVIGLGLDRITSEVVYNDDLQIYEVTLLFKFNELNKSLCLSNINAVLITEAGVDASINDLGDKLLINGTDNLIY